MNREQKIKLLKDLATGKASIKDIQVPLDLSVLTCEELRFLLKVKTEYDQKWPDVPQDVIHKVEKIFSQIPLRKASLNTRL